MFPLSPNGDTIHRLEWKSSRLNDQKVSPDRELFYPPDAE